MDMTNLLVLFEWAFKEAKTAQALLLLHQVDCAGAIHIVFLGFEVVNIIGSSFKVNIE